MAADFFKFGASGRGSVGRPNAPTTIELKRSDDDCFQKITVVYTETETEAFIDIFPE